MSDEVERIIGQLVEKNDKLRESYRKLENEVFSHGPEGRNYTNQQYVDLLKKFESQKEEIEELKEFQSEVADEFSWMNRLLNSYLKSENRLNAEIESLKAIIELAVNGLKEVANLNTGFPRLVAREILSEIERLQNEKP